MVRVAKKERDAAMAERPSSGSDGGVRRHSRRDSNDTASSHRGTPTSSKERRTKRSNNIIKERWLLTRKTWRYMADAGRRLIPEGTHNRQEDIPKIEQYFQEVCQKEPKFLLLRKSSYPGSLGFRTHRYRRLFKGGSYRTKANSADEADDPSRSQVPNKMCMATSGGRFDIFKTRKDWFVSSDSTPTTPVALRHVPQENSEVKALADMLQKYLNMKGEISNSSRCLNTKTMHSNSALSGTGQSFDYQSLIEKLQQHLNLIMTERESDLSLNDSRDLANATDPSTMLPYRGDYVHKSLVETLNRHYAKSANREHVISGILTDRKLLEKLYFDLRCTRGFRGPRATGAYTSPSHWWVSPRSRLNSKQNHHDDWLPSRYNVVQSPPLIAVQGPSTDRGFVDTIIQTDPLTKDIMETLLIEREQDDSSQTDNSGKNSRRRNSVDHDDVSPSVSDTIKRYLKMARKKSIDSDKFERFNRVNYDRNLTNIRNKGEISKPGDDGNSKGCQTNDNWMHYYRDSVFMSSGMADIFSDADTTSPISRNASSRSSIDAGLGSEELPSTPKHHQSFLSQLLHGSNTYKDKPHSAPGSPALTSSNSSGGVAMQKSKSSSSVVHHSSRLVAKKIWRSRSKSSSRSHQPSVWTPQVTYCFFFFCFLHELIINIFFVNCVNQ